MKKRAKPKIKTVLLPPRKKAQTASMDAALQKMVDYLNALSGFAHAQDLPATSSGPRGGRSRERRLRDRRAEVSLELSVIEEMKHVLHNMKGRRLTVGSEIHHLVDWLGIRTISRLRRVR